MQSQKDIEDEEDKQKKKIKKGDKKKQSVYDLIKNEAVKRYGAKSIGY